MATTRLRFLRACEASMERLAMDRHYFAKPVRALFNDVRHFFPIGEQLRVYGACEAHMTMATEFVDSQLRTGMTFDGSPVCCHASTRRGNRVRARAAAGEQVLPVPQAPRRGARGRSRLKL